MMIIFLIILKIFNITPIRCGLHTFKLGIYESLNIYYDFLYTIREIIKKFRSEKKRQIFKLYKISIPFLDNVTRWSSTYNMVNSLYKIFDLIDILS